MIYFEALVLFLISIALDSTLNHHLEIENREAIAFKQEELPSVKCMLLCLQSLPRTLNETYERILCSIDKNWIEDVRRILNFLCFSSRPLTIQELIDAVAIELHEAAYFDGRRRLRDGDDFCQVCLDVILTTWTVYRKIKIRLNTCGSTLREYPCVPRYGFKREIHLGAFWDS